VITKLSLFFVCESLALVCWQAFISSVVMKLDFKSQPSSKSTLPFAGLQHMQQCQVNFHSILAPKLWSKWMVHENGIHSGGLNPWPLSHESSALTTRPRLLAPKKKITLPNWKKSSFLVCPPKPGEDHIQIRNFFF
jgi:hypothetical protein